MIKIDSNIREYKNSAGIATGVLFIILFFLSISSQSQVVDVGGTLPADRTFYADTTYIVVQDLIVDNTNSLTVEAGTVIKVNYGRSIIIDNGSLYSLGTEEDSVHFFPNHTFPTEIWKWNGIIIKNSDYENPTSIKYTCIKDSETALHIENAINILVENSSLVHSQNIGVHIINSSFCFIVNSSVENNYNGIEITTGNNKTTSNNMVLNSTIKNFNHNIYAFIENGGVYENNVITENLISEGNNGVWIDNGGLGINSGNSISKNFIIKNGGDVGYGLFLALDSTTVSNNIFWKNNVAVFSEEKGRYCNIINNSFYKNRWSIAIGGGSEGNNISDNTFSESEFEAIGFKAANNVYLRYNNLMNSSQSDIVVNSSPDDINAIENYWGTDNATEIRKFIYDHEDDPSLGTIVFEPFQDSILVRNPISPPYLVKKQIINDLVRVSFNKNAEYDLGNYYLYYGNYQNYSFSKQLDIGLDTTVVVPGDISINDEIAVTSHDTNEYNLDSQKNGNESAYAFAMLYPYAGPDTIICKLTQSIQLNESNIPYSHDNLYWTTTGDGTFSNTSILKPVYYPGIGDSESGGAILTINVVNENDTLTDSFFLKIVDDPIALAGNDTTVVADTGVFLSQAAAYNFNTVIWKTNGDGFFSDDTLVNPTYFPGDTDISLGAVLLIMTVTSECGYSTDSIIINIEPHFSVEGKLWDDISNAYQGNIVAFRKDEYNTRAIQKIHTVADGKFRFPKVMKGEYYIYGVPDTLNTEYLLPGYYAHKRRWQSAHIINVNANVYDLDITLSARDYILPAGIGLISGSLNMPSGSTINKEVYCEPWFDGGSKELCLNGGLSNITVFLLTSDQSHILDFTLTDNQGNFYFGELPFGNYILGAELAGYISLPSENINLNPEHTAETDVSISIQEGIIGATLKDTQKYPEFVDVYPNPAKENIVVVCDIKNEDQFSYVVYDRFGNDVSNYISINSDSKLGLSLNITHLKTGMYIGRIVSASGVYKIKFLKR